jgi:hypothetical protein
MSTATPDDVRGVISTDLTDSELQAYLDDAEFEASQAITDYDTALSTEEKTQLEKYYAALLVRTLRDKGIESASRETASVSYEGPALSTSELRSKVDQRDPSGTLAYATDTDRYTGSTYRSET